MWHQISWEDVMAILEHIVPGMMKSKLSRSIAELAEAARQESVRQELSPEMAALWEALCGGAHQILCQLLVRNTIKQMDWGLKSHRGRVSQPRLMVMYWWMLLYQLVLFKNRGAEGYSAEEHFPALYDVAKRFMERAASSTQFNGVAPGPWEERWSSRVTLEASLSLYNRTIQLLGLYNDTNLMINRVSLFTTAAERAYDVAVKKGLTGRMEAN
jgi:hypothetical protein